MTYHEWPSVQRIGTGLMLGLVLLSMFMAIFA